MEEHLVPDTPAVGWRPNAAPVAFEPSCCSPIRSKLNTATIKLFSVLYIILGVSSIGLGVVACIYECMYRGLSLPAGVLFIATGVIGLCVRKHGAVDVVFMFMSAFSFLYGIALLVVMLAALPERESKEYWFCSSYTCYRSYSSDNCCEEWKTDLRWERVGIDLGILVVGVIAMVTALLATTLSLRDMNWVKICGLKSNMEEQNVTESAQPVTRGSSGGSLAAMKRCWKPCDGPSLRTSVIILSGGHILFGVISIGLGIIAVIVECRFSHVGTPVWTGLLIFTLTGVYGLLSESKKGSYIPCFFALSILAFFLSINMLCWASEQLYQEEICNNECDSWGCNHTASSDYYYCHDCPGDCCSMNWNCNTDSKKVIVDVSTIVIGVLEMLVCMATFGLSFSQFSCYVCCRSCNSNCYKPETKGTYQMVMTSEGNLMMVPVSNSQVGIPMMVHQPMMLQHQSPMLQSSQLPQNQPSATQVYLPNTQCAVPHTTLSEPGRLQNQGNVLQSNTPQNLPAMVATSSGNGQLVNQQAPITHGSPMVQGQGQLMMVGQGQPMVVQGIGQPMVVQGMGQPMVVQGMGQPMMVQGKGQPMVLQGQPMMIQGSQGPQMVQGMGQVTMAQGQQGNQQVMLSAQEAVQPEQHINKNTNAQMPQDELGSFGGVPEDQA